MHEALVLKKNAVMIPFGGKGSFCNIKNATTSCPISIVLPAVTCLRPLDRATVSLRHKFFKRPQIFVAWKPPKDPSFKHLSYKRPGREACSIHITCLQFPQCAITRNADELGSKRGELVCSVGTAHHPYSKQIKGRILGDRWIHD